MLRLTSVIKFWWQTTRPRTPESVAADTYVTYSYAGHHRFVEAEPVLPAPDVWRTLKLGWQAHIRAIPVVEVFR